MDTKLVYDAGDNVLDQYKKIIETGTSEEFISFAKKYNIFQVPRSSVYRNMCILIKARLDREGLSYETVRPE